MKRNGGIQKNLREFVYLVSNEVWLFDELKTEVRLDVCHNCPWFHYIFFHHNAGNRISTTIQVSPSNQGDWSEKWWYACGLLWIHMNFARFCCMMVPWKMTDWCHASEMLRTNNIPKKPSFRVLVSDKMTKELLKLTYMYMLRILQCPVLLDHFSIGIMIGKRFL